MRTPLYVIMLFPLSSVVQAGQTEHRLSVVIPQAAHTITETDSGDRVYVEGFGTLHEAGVPQLPVRIFPIAIPPGAAVVRVSYTAAEPVTLPTRHEVAPAPVWKPIGPANEQARTAEQQRFDANRAAIYGKDEPYPPVPVDFVRTAGYRGYNLAEVRVTPLAYRPASGRLLRYDDITVHVDYRLPEQGSALIAEASPAVQRNAQDLILNYDQATAWYTGLHRPDSERYEFVVVTPAELVDSVAPLVAWEQQKGRGTQVVTTQWIAANYTGVDQAEQIRAFLRDKYSAADWGIEHVLLVGHYDDLLMRLVWQDVGYGRPQTDAYYAELSLPDDQSWDSDGDGRYAEDEDAIDFYTEICVGRIPWSDPATVQHICQKSVLFEQSHDPTYKKNMLLLGGFFWPDTDCAELMTTIAMLPHLTGWSGIFMYEWGYSAYWSDYDLTNANVVAEWSGGTYAVVTWCGHGSPTSAHRYYPDMPAFITAADCAVLNDDYPSIVFADSCHTSSPAQANLGREMLGQGAIGYVGATQVAGGRACWAKPADGSSQTLNYLFTSYVSCGRYTQGEALQRALRETYLQGLWRWPRYEVLEWGALYGNPDLGIGAVPALHIQFPDGLPDQVAPGAPAVIPLRIDPVQDTLVAGSETLHYRTDGGTFQTVPLTSLGDRNYEAVLPVLCCGQTPEFYVSASGTQSGLVTQPANAPSEVFTASVGTFTAVFHDDFEEFNGWMAENLGATDGNWQRDVPVNDPNYSYDPFSDADGSGKCCLTANRLGDSDVDGGGVRLTSPLVDMTAANITLRYSFYLYAEDQGPSDYLLVEVSSNALAGPWRELVRHLYNNGLSWRTDSFTGADLQALGIPLTDQMHVRFTAQDGGSNDVVEAGVDAFEVLSFDCAYALPGDLDGDCTVDLDDFLLLSECIAGPQVTTPPPSCDPGDFAHGDLDADGDLDVEDFAAFQAAFDVN
ncbi:MAG TPA: C25 family cysteine peptidase [Phycisphaerae bacterium]|nr:C25 family cysteine peptidase [Phycisphaerae bacterium]